MSKPRVLAIIPARGNSKGIPNKNIRLFDKKPLISYTINQALNLKKEGFIDRIIVSTDSPKIASVAKKYKAEVPFLRPKNLATSKSNVIDAVLHLLQEIKSKEDYTPDYILLLQTTSPLREEDDVIKCFKKIKSPKTDAVLTICPTHALLYNIDKLSDSISLVNKKINLKKSSNRQSMPKGYKLNGCFVYLIKHQTLIKEKTFFPKKTKAVICDAWRSIDLDNPSDWALAENTYKNKDKIKKEIEKIEKEKSNLKNH